MKCGTHFYLFLLVLNIDSRRAIIGDISTVVEVVEKTFTCPLPISFYAKYRAIAYLLKVEVRRSNVDYVCVL